MSRENPHDMDTDTVLAKIDAALIKHQGEPVVTHLEYNKSLILLKLGRLREGWPLYEKRFDLPTAKFGYTHFPVERWTGQDVAGKDIFVWLEQGLGDQVIGASMLPDLIAKVGAERITLLANRILNKTLRRSFPGITVYKVGEPVSEQMETWGYDYQLTLADLGAMFRNADADFTGKPFLVPDADKVAYFRAKYRNMNGLNIGISWRSASDSTGAEKSMTLGKMGPVFMTYGAHFHDLQYNDTSEDRAQLKAHGVNLRHDDEIDQLLDMDTFIAQVAAMDVVVTTSNTLAHIAGALGVRTHVILPEGRGSLWYWFKGRQDCPWYGSVTLHRQTIPGDWRGPVSKVADMIHPGMDLDLRLGRCMA